MRLIGDKNIKKVNFLGEETSYNTSDFIILPLPIEITSTYLGGTANGPRSLLNSAENIDAFIPDFPNTPSIYVEEINKDLISQSELYRREVNMDIKNKDQINKYLIYLEDLIKSTTKEILKNRKFPIIIGGEHSISLGYFKALSEKYKNFSIVQIDAHSDLEVSYRGLKNSHASVMYNALEEIPNLSSISCIGVRNITKEEFNYSKSNPKSKLITSESISIFDFTGRTWDNTIRDFIIPTISSKNIIISLDVDGMETHLCPNTGTPNPGGLEYNKLIYLLRNLFYVYNVIGFDIVEIGEGEYDGNVASRLLNYMLKMKENF